jgi:hypothetical protein
MLNKQIIMSSLLFEALAEVCRIQIVIAQLRQKRDAGEEECCHSKMCSRHPENNDTIIICKGCKNKHVKRSAAYCCFCDKMSELEDEIANLSK